MRHLGGLACVIAAALAACTESATSGPKGPACDAAGMTGPAGVTLTKLRVSRVDKLDLLFVVDNSISMADKQSELARRIPELIASVVDPTPDPVSGKPRNVADVHVGVISSSLGSYGTSACAPEVTNKHNDDRGRLLPRAGEWGAGAAGWKVDSPGAEPTAAACPAPVTASALSWVFDPTRPEAAGAMFKGFPGGAQQLQVATSCVVQSAKEDGCGYEAPWEAMYHFLVDPAPYAKAATSCTFGISGDVCGSNKIVVEGLDAELLAQRKAFLRHDSLLGVIILSDENDASLKPAGLNWLPWGYGKGIMQRGWGACADVPDDFEPDTVADFTRLHDEYKCFSCFEDARDPACSVKWATDPLNSDVDGRNLRGFHQVQRYGYNFLWGRQRYVDAFTKVTVMGSDFKLGPNPVFAGGLRDPSLVTVAAIVGVPHQLVSESDGRPKQLTDGDWETIVGPIGKRDPHMIESIAPRAGVPKFGGDRSIDPVNGGERNVPDGDDLQYACIARRALDQNGCYSGGTDCEGADAASKNPLCASAQPASCSAPPAGAPQAFFKAYPGLRHLRIVRDLGASGFVGSICAQSYRPAVSGIVDKLKASMNAPCLRSSLAQDDAGNVSCLLLEVMKEGTDAGRSCEEIGKGLCTPGAAPCRREGSAWPPTTPALAAAQLYLPIAVVGADGLPRPTSTQAIAEGNNVYVIGRDEGPPRKHLVCELQQLAGAELQTCINDPSFTIDPSAGGGFCYSTNPVVVGAHCTKLGAPQTIRYLGGAQPRVGSEVFTFCTDPRGGGADSGC